MRYINPRFTYLLTYLSLSSPRLLGSFARLEHPNAAWALVIRMIFKSTQHNLYIVSGVGRVISRGDVKGAAAAELSIGKQCRIDGIAVVKAFQGSMRLNARSVPPVSNHQTDHPLSHPSIAGHTSVFIVSYRLQLPILANSTHAVSGRRKMVL